MEEKTTWLKDINAKTGVGSGLRFNQGKLRYDLLHPKALEDMVDILTYGANKYTVLDDAGNVLNDGANNWRQGLSWKSVYASLERHMEAIKAGEDYDRDTGKLHIAHAACNVHFLNAFYYDFPQGDDRVKMHLKLPKIGLDIDGVLADFVNAWADKYGTTRAPSSWYYDRKMLERFNDLREKKELDELYMSIKPLITPEDLPFEPHCYITSRPVSKEITEAWLDMHGFPARPVYSIGIRENKVDVAKESGIEIFIDDAYKNFVELNNAGIFTYLFTQSHNKRFDVGHMRLNSLKELPLLK